MHYRIDSALCTGYAVGLHYGPLLPKVMGFVTAAYHTGSLAGWLEQLSYPPQNQNGNGIMPANGKDKSDREVAAAIAVAMALAIKTSKSASPRPTASNAWRSYGRREQLLSRSMGSRGWR